jgi:hypothetical protein
MFDENYMIYVWVALISIVGGTAQHIRKIKQGIIQRFSFSEWFGDIFISAFVGYMTYNLCMHYNVSMELTAFFIGISSHLGTRAIILLEEIIYQSVKEKFDLK